LHHKLYQQNSYSVDDHGSLGLVLFPAGGSKDLEPLLSIDNVAPELPPGMQADSEQGKEEDLCCQGERHDA